MTTEAPLPTAVPAATPSQDDRVLAACAHLSFLAGFWLVAPIAIYVIKRKESRFVAFHALQAVMVQLLFGVTMTFGFAASIVLIATAGMSRQPEIAALAAVVPIVGLLFGALALFVVHAYAAYSAWRGAGWTIPIAGRIARAIHNADDGALKAPAT